MLANSGSKKVAVDIKESCNLNGTRDCVKISAYYHTNQLKWEWKSPVMEKQ